MSKYIYGCCDVGTSYKKYTKCRCGGGEAGGEWDISTKICTHEQALHCISEVMQFAIESNV
jgi:hypothetical protein